MSSATARRGRWLRGALVALIGIGALALPAANHSAHVADPWWGPETMAGDAVLVALAAVLIACGVWLARKDWERRYLTTVVVWTYAVSSSVTVLFAWAIALQLWVVGDPEPYVIALDGVLIAAIVAFTSGVLTAKHQRDSDFVRRSETAYRALADEVMDCSATATVVTDDEDRIVWLNQSAGAYFGLDQEAAVGCDRAAVIDSVLEDPPRAIQGGETRQCTPETAVYKVTPGENRDGRWLERCRDSIDEGLHAGGRIEQYTDVTERREAVESLGARETELQQLSNAISQAAPRGEERVEQLLDVGRELLGAEYAAVSRLDVDGGYQLEVVRSDNGAPRTGNPLPEAHLHCRDAVEQAGTIQAGSRPYAVAVGGFKFDHAAAATDGGMPEPGFDTYLGVPLAGSNEQPGTLCVLRREPRSFNQWERTVTDLIASLVGAELERRQLLNDGRSKPAGPQKEALEHERERLEFVNRIIRHNILNGLNLLNARAQQLESVADENSEAAGHLDVIRGRVGEMADLVTTIRTFTNAVVDGADHEISPVPVRARLDEEIETARDRYDATFQVRELPEPGLRVGADELLPEVFENVLSNAVEHNDADEPVVEVWSCVDRGEESVTPAAGGSETQQLTVHVADNGPGIPEATRRAMESQGDANLDDPGHGFGFYLVREVVESYGGAVRIRENEPTGTIIELTFPLAEAQDS